MYNGPAKEPSRTWTWILGILMFWGTYWAYHRHGFREGEKAANNGVYAVYKGVESLWDQPEWKDDYNKQTQAIGMVIARSDNPTKGAAEEKEAALGEFHRWARNVPKDDLNELKATTREFALAMVEYTQIHYFAEIDRISLKEGKEYPQIQMRIEKFEKVPRFSMLWELQTKVARSHNFPSLTNGEPAPLAADADPGSVKKHLEKSYEDKKERILRLVEKIYDISSVAD